LSHRILSLLLQDGPDAAPRPVAIAHAVIAGWTGRDKAALEHHIVELEKLGVARPTSTPIFYRVAAARLCTDLSIEVTGTQSSGEVEFVLLQTGGRLWVGVGSDHTDREVETTGVTISKQMCDKPVGVQFWPFDEVAPHWERLLLRSFIPGEGGMEPYQEGSVTAMLAPHDLLALWNAGGTLAEGTMMFCGTLPARGGIRPAPRFAFELEDPVLGRIIRHSYEIETLPVLG
jgi:hypothetical protein